MVKYRNCDGNLVLKVTDDKVVSKIISYLSAMNVRFYFGLLNLNGLRLYGEGTHSKSTIGV